MSQEAPRDSVFRSVYHRDFYAPQLAKSNVIASSKDSLNYVQRLGLSCRLQVHAGCVNTVHWNSTGEYLLSGSDDQFVAISNPHTERLLYKYKTAHRANIFSAQFMPQSNDQTIVSCSGDGVVFCTEIMAPGLKRAQLSWGERKPVPLIYEHDDHVNASHQFNCHKSGTTHEVLTMPSEPRCFMSCGEDGTVRYFDLRLSSNCHKTCCKDNILIFSPSAVNAMDLAPISHNYLAVGSSDAIVRIYDRRYLSVIDFNDSSISTEDRHTRPIKAFPIPLPTKRHYRITCVKFSPEESELLASFSSEYLYLFDLKHPGVGPKHLQASVSGARESTESDLTDTMSPSMMAEQVTRRLRLRGDWSDTGPDARPEHDPSGRVEIGQVRPQLHATLMSRMTEVISRMLTDPRTRIGLTGSGVANDNRAGVPLRTGTDEQAPSTSTAWRQAVSRSLNIVRSEFVSSLTPRLLRSTPHIVVEQAEAQGAPNTLTDEAEAAGADTNAQYQDATATLNDELAGLDMTAKDAVDGNNGNDDDIDDSDGINEDFSYSRMKFVGHRNARTMIKQATFWGSNYVMCGSDCGHIFTWDRRSGKLVMLLQADRHVVNCLQPHPQLPYLASSGIDYDVKIWAPILPAPNFDQEAAEDLMKRNAVMLEQTKDTITVPATFMIRMLACIHSLRNRDRSENAGGSGRPAANVNDDNEREPRDAQNDSNDADGDDEAPSNNAQ